MLDQINILSKIPKQTYYQVIKAKSIWFKLNQRKFNLIQFDSIWFNLIQFDSIFDSIDSIEWFNCRLASDFKKCKSIQFDSIESNQRKIDSIWIKIEGKLNQTVQLNQKPVIGGIYEHRVPSK